MIKMGVKKWRTEATDRGEGGKYVRRSRFVKNSRATESVSQEPRYTTFPTGECSGKVERSYGCDAVASIRLPAD
jgi:hypothetical protein